MLRETHAPAERKIPILMYHSISTSDSPRFRVNAVPVVEFQRQVDVIASLGCQTLTVSQYGQILAGNAFLPPRPVLFTFDDGYADFFDQALPYLEKYQYTATVYMLSALVGGSAQWLAAPSERSRPLMNRGHLTYLAQSGFEIGSHGCHHLPLDTLRQEDARNEIQLSKKNLEAMLEIPIQSFAYPYGYYTAAIRRMVAQAGYTTACSVEKGISSLRDRPFDLARIPIQPGLSEAQFHALLQGHGLAAAPVFPSFRSKIRGALRRSLARVRPPAAPEWGSIA
jgi:peptidoglycan/xylan/chitin deacetylase (PgdA/CDA1 family)